MCFLSFLPPFPVGGFLVRTCKARAKFLEKNRERESCAAVSEAARQKACWLTGQLQAQLCHACVPLRHQSVLVSEQAVWVSSVHVRAPMRGDGEKRSIFLIIANSLGDGGRTASHWASALIHSSPPNTKSNCQCQCRSAGLSVRRCHKWRGGKHDKREGAVVRHDDRDCKPD